MTLPVLPLGHGLVQRADLPLPEDVFIITAAVVLAVSFVGLAVLWSQPRLERPAWKPLPEPVARFFGSAILRAVCGAIGVLLLVTTIVSGYVGPAGPFENFAPTFVYVIFWVGLVFASLLFGDVFRAFNPWLAIGEALRWKGRRPYPERLGYWPAVVGLFCFAWLELASGSEADPRDLATATVIYTVVTLAAMWRYGAREWADNGEAFSVYFGLLARVSAFEVRDRRAGVRMPLSGLARFEPRTGAVWLLAVMIGITTFDGFSSGSIWRDVEAEVSGVFTDLGASFDLADILTDTVGLTLAVLVIAGFYALGIAGARTVGGPDSERLRGGFVHSLVPIAVVYVLAHYLTYLVFQGQAMGYLVSDPFGQGWDIFGTANGAIDFGVLSQNATWYFQVAFVVAGHVAALMLAHDRALTVYDNARLAVRSQYWMLLIMIGFTTLALWLLKSAGA